MVQLEDGTWDTQPFNRTKPAEVFSKILDEGQIKVLIVNGDFDFTTNYFGTEKLLESFEWYGQEDFKAYNNGELKRWYYTNSTSHEENVPGGDMRVHNKLTYVRIHHSGLYVYKDKPELMTDLLKQWIADENGQLKGAF